PLGFRAARGLFGGRTFSWCRRDHVLSGRVAIPVSMRDMERLRRTARPLYQRPTGLAIKAGLEFQRVDRPNATVRTCHHGAHKTQVPDGDAPCIARAVGQLASSSVGTRG